MSLFHARDSHGDLCRESRGVESETRTVGWCQLMKDLKDHELGIYPEGGRESLKNLSKGRTGCQSWDEGSEHADEQRSKCPEDLQGLVVMGRKMTSSLRFLASPAACDF